MNSSQKICMTRPIGACGASRRFLRLDELVGGNYVHEVMELTPVYDEKVSPIPGRHVPAGDRPP
jgi:hypothetical protein